MSDKILIVDDEVEIADLIELYLNNEDYTVFKFYSSKEALECINTTELDLAILDIMLPEIDGFTLCQKIRSKHTYPIIMLTAKSDEQDELQGFELGVDEYISKPFSPKILVARVLAILRRANASAEDVIEYGGISLNRSAHEVIIDGEKVDLSFKEFELLAYFMENKDIALSRERILNHVWDYDYFGDARTIDTHVKKLRSKMGDKCGKYIKTIWGMGYKFEVNE